MVELVLNDLKIVFIALAGLLMISVGVIPSEQILGTVAAADVFLGLGLILDILIITIQKRHAQ